MQNKHMYILLILCTILSSHLWPENIEINGRMAMDTDLKRRPAFSLSPRAIQIWCRAAATSSNNLTNFVQMALSI